MLIKRSNGAVLRGHDEGFGLHNKLLDFRAEDDIEHENQNSLDTMKNKVLSRNIQMKSPGVLCECLEFHTFLNDFKLNFNNTRHKTASCFLSDCVDETKGCRTFDMDLKASETNQAFLQ